jgi:hypothetical protein
MVVSRLRVVVSLLIAVFATLGTVAAPAVAAPLTTVAGSYTIHIVVTYQGKTHETAGGFTLNPSQTWTVYNSKGDAVASGGWARSGKTYTFTESGGAGCVFSGTHNRHGFNRKKHEGPISCHGGAETGTWYATGDTPSSST